MYSTILGGAFEIGSYRIPPCHGDRRERGTVLGHKFVSDFPTTQTAMDVTTYNCYFITAPLACVVGCKIVQKLSQNFKSERDINKKLPEC